MKATLLCISVKYVRSADCAWVHAYMLGNMRPIWWPALTLIIWSSSHITEQKFSQIWSSHFKKLALKDTRNSRPHCIILVHHLGLAFPVLLQGRMVGAHLHYLLQTIWNTRAKNVCITGSLNHWIKDQVYQVTKP